MIYAAEAAITELRETARFVAGLLWLAITSAALEEYEE
jgi:hypothetical protein